MASKKYPLEPLFLVRSERAEGAKRELARTIQTREAAVGALRAAQEERVRGAVALRAVREAELQALERGELRATDLMRAAAWEVSATDEQAQRERVVAKAEGGLANARAQEESARGVLAQRKAEDSVVVRDRERWAAREQRADDAKEEEAVAEAWRPNTP